MRVAAAVVCALAMSAWAGCAVVPYSDESLPPIEGHGLRITEGVGTSSDYGPVIEVEPRSTIQVLTEITDGNTVNLTIPRGPATEFEVSVVVEGEPEEHVASTIRSASGEPLTLENLYEFDPGYIGVEDNSDAETLSLRIATPRLTGTGQGQVPFTFKTRAR